MEDFIVEDEVSKINELTGLIISMALHIEDYLEFFISNYFVKPQNQKTFFLDKHIIKDLSFEKKLNLFVEICKRERYNKHEIEILTEIIRRVQKTRNDFAHQALIINPKEKNILFGNRKNMKLSILDIKVILKEVEENTITSIKKITEFYNKYSNEGTIDEKPINFNIGDIK